MIIKLVKGNKVLNKDEKLTKQSRVTKQSFPKCCPSNLNIQEKSFIQSKDYHNLSDPVQRVIAEDKHHPSVLLTQNKISNRYRFSFSEVSKTDLEKEIKNINPRIATTKNNIPPRILKKSHKVSFYRNL